MFNSPLSKSRAQDLINTIHPTEGAFVVDLGCGEGAFLRLMAMRYAIRGVGVDNHSQRIKTALAESPHDQAVGKTSFVCADAAAYLHGMEPADLIVCMGAEFIFGGLDGLLHAAKQRLKPLALLLVGTIYWKHPPPADYLALMGGQNPHFDLPTTVEMALNANYDPMVVQRSSDDEWDSFESQRARHSYRAARHENDPDLREEAWTWQHGYLKWGMETMGFCWLVLQKR